MPLSPRTHEAFRLAMILHTLKDAPPELRSALMNDDASDEEVTPHLHAYLGSLKSQLQPSAQDGGQVAPPPDGKGKSTASRAMSLARQFEANEPAKADAGTDRRAKVGSYFKK